MTHNRLDVRLRAIEPADLPILKKWRNELKEYFREYRFINDLHQEAWYKSTLTDKAYLHYVVDVYENGWLLVGSCNWSAIDWINRSAELGIYIGDQDYWHQGVGLKTMLELHRIAFEVLNLDIVRLEVYDFNPAVRLYRKFGYKDAGVWRMRKFREGAYHDAFLMDMTREEWSALYGRGCKTTTD